MRRVVGMMAMVVAMGLFVLCAEDAAGQAVELDESKRMTVEVDATGLGRHLLKSVMTLPAEGGEENAYWYPMWIPGIHGPSEQVRNIAGLVFETMDGDVLAWR